LEARKRELLGLYFQRADDAAIKKASEGKERSLMLLAPLKSMRVNGELRGVSFNQSEGGLGNQLITKVV
jgi:hypothetical protein